MTVLHTDAFIAARHSPNCDAGLLAAGDVLEIPYLKVCHPLDVRARIS